MSRAHRAFLEKQRPVDPAALDRIVDMRREIRYGSRSPGESVERAGEIRREAGSVNFVMPHDAMEIAVRALQDLEKPVRHLHVRVAAQLAEHRGRFDGLVPHRIEFPEQSGSTDLGHGTPLFYCTNCGCCS